MANKLTPEQHCAQVHEQLVVQESVCSFAPEASPVVAQQQSTSVLTVAADAMGATLPSATNMAIITATAFIRKDYCTCRVFCPTP